MHPFRFLHTADLHLGTPFVGLRKSLPESWLERLQNASYYTFRRVVDLAIEHQVDFVVVSGDVFDFTEIPMAVQFELKRNFERLQQKNIRVFLSHGNHDPLGKLRPLNWPENVFVFPAVPAVIPIGYEVPSTVIDLETGTRVQVAGFSYRTSELYESLADAFVRDPSVDFALGMYHGAVGPTQGHQNYAATTVQDLQRRGFDYWALGHIHQRGVLNPHAPVVVYPGNPQGRHIREPGPRGCVLVLVNDRNDIQLSDVATADIVWTSLSVSLDGVSSVQEAVQMVLIKIHAESAKNPALDWIIRVELRGMTQVHGELTDEQWLDLLVQEVSLQEPRVLVERVQVETAPMLDMDTLRQSEEVIGEFLRVVDAYRADLTGAKEELAPLLREVFHAGNELPFEAVKNEDMAKWLEDAERAVLAFLTERRVTG